jgi:hypothetical protein
MRVLTFLGLASLTLLTFMGAMPANAQTFQQAPLLQAMTQRIEYGPALRALKRDGFLGARPQTRVEYSDFYLPKRTFSVMGSKVVVVQENYLSRDIGCCADPGISLFFEGSNVASLTQIMEFATAHKCVYRQGNALITPELPPSFLRLKPNKTYAMLRCSDGDEARRG